MKRYFILFILLVITKLGWSQTAYVNTCFNVTSNSTDSSIVLNWPKAASTQNFASYNLYYQNSSPYQVLNFVKIASITDTAQTSFEFLNASPNNTHYFYLTIENNLGQEYCKSNYANSFLKQAQELNGPQNLISISGSFGYYFEWRKLDSLNSSGYYIYLDTLPNPSQILDSTNSYNDTSLFVTNLDSAKVYFIRVASKLGGQKNSGYSNEIIDFYSGGSYSGPSNLSATNSQGIKLKWDPVSNNFPNHFRYLVYRGFIRNNLQPILYTNQLRNVNDTLANLPNTPNSIKYYYAVKAENYVGYQTELSNIDSLIYIDTVAPQAPVLLEAVAGDQNVFLKWSKYPNQNVDFQNYNLYVDTFSNPTTLNTQSFGVSDTSIIIGGLQNNLTYYFRMKTLDNSSNISSFSNELAAMPIDTSGPEPISNLSAPIDSAKVNLNFTPSANLNNDFDFYKVYQKTQFTTYQVIDTINSININSYTKTGLKNNRKYFFKVVPVDLLGNEGINNPELIITPTRVERELNDSWFNANLIDSTKIGFINSNIDDDFYKFTITQPTQVTLKTDSVYFLHPSVGQNITNTYIDLFDTTGSNIIASNNNDPSNGNYSRIVYSLPAAGTYYLRVSNNNTGVSGYYSLKITKLEPDPYEPNGNIFNATLLADTQIINNLSIYPVGDKDYFKFSTQPNARAQISIYNPFYNGTIKFFNRQNQSLQTTVGNATNFIVPDTGFFFFSYEVPTFTTPNYILDFKIIPPISYSDSFRINEIKYTQNGVQFIEIENLHSSDIVGESFTISEIAFTFPDGFRFQPSSYTVIANDSTLFYNKYGFYPNLTWGNQNLSFTNQNLTLLDSNNSLIDFVLYRNGNNGFPLVSDTTQSIELINSSLNNNLGSSWKLTEIPNGTPTHKNSFPRNYSADIYEPNNNVASAKNIQFKDSLQLSISELQDTADYFLIKPRVGDTINIITVNKDIRCAPTFKIYQKDGTLLFLDTLNPQNQISFIANASDSIYFKITPYQFNEQFILNEGSFKVKILVQEKILVSPWNEQFETIETSFLPNGYRVYDLDNNNQKWGVAIVNSGLNGTKSLELSKNTLGNNDWLILPPTSVRQDDYFSFYAKPSATNFPEKLEVWVSDRNATNPSHFNIKLDSITVDSSAYKLFRFNMNQFIGQVIRIALRGISVNQNILYVDNIEFSPPLYDASVRGFVKDYYTNIPIGGVKVQNQNNIVYTDSLGYYEINELPYGNVTLNFDKVNYSAADYTFSLQQGDTINFNPKLAQTLIDTIYYNPFDRGLTQGFSQNLQGSGNWRTIDSLIYSGQVITAFEDDSMLVFGSNLGYNPSTLSLFTLKPGLGFDFTQYKTIDLTFAINHQIDTSDFLFLLGNGSFIININTDTVVDSLDRYSGNSNGWQQKSVELDYLNNFDDLDLGFLFGSNAYFTSGFGVALDNILLLGEREIEKPTPTNFYAESFIPDTIKLRWNSDTSQTNYYSVYRSSLKSPFTLIATTPDTFYFDTNVVNGRLYNYYVIANYAFGESDKSNNSLAQSGIPQTLAIPYSQSFNNLFADTLPAKWGYDLSINNPWLAGDSLAARTFNAFFRGKSRFLYGNFFSFNVFGSYYESILSTPWFNTTTAANNLVLSFDYSGDNTFENHILVYKDALSSPWKVLDTLDGNFYWKKYRYDLTTLAGGKNYFQIGFLFADDSTKTNTPNVGFAIDNFSIRSLNKTKVYGQVTSETGQPLNNAVINVKTQNSETWNTQTEAFFTTDSLGYYSSSINFVYQNIPYKFSTGYFGHDSINISNQVLTSQDSLEVNLQLQLQLAPPIINSLNNDSLGYPILGWQAPLKVGELSYDDGTFNLFDSLASGTSGGIYFQTTTNQSFVLNQIAVYTKQTTNSSGFILKAFSANQSGFPVFTDTIFSMQISNSNFSQGWNFVSVNQLIDTNRFCLVIYPTSQPGETFKIGFSANQSQTNSFWKVNSNPNYYSTPEGLLMRAYINVGNNNFQHTSINYNGTYNVYRLLNSAPSPQQIDSNLTQLSFRDTAINIGDTALYYLTAKNSFGESEISNIVGFVMKGLPFAKENIGNLDLDFLYTSQTGSNSFSLQNIGLDSLVYSTTLQVGLTEFHQIDTPNVNLGGIENSALYCFNNPQLFDTVKLVFSIENRNLIGDNHQSVSINFPKGVKVLSSSNLDIFGTSRFLLSGGQTGDSIDLTFIDPNSNGKGELYPFEGGSFEVTVVLDSLANFPIKLGYLIEGDSKNKKQDTIILGNLPFSSTLNGSSGSLQPAATNAIGSIIQINQPPKNGARLPMYFKTLTNDNNKPEIIAPFYINFDPARGVFRGLVTDDINNDPIPNAAVTGAGKIDTTDNAGWFYFSDIPVGKYEFLGRNIYYQEGGTNGTLINHNDTSTLLLTLSPKVLKPINLKAKGIGNNIELNWQLENPTLFFDMEQPVNSPTFNIKDWKTVDADGDGNSWDYYSAAPYQGFFSIATTANPSSQNSDWLISKQIRIEENNANFSFYASPQDLNLSEERFVVRASQTGDDVADFTDSLYSFKFPVNVNNWQKFTIPLNNYLSDSIFIAIECVSNGQFKLKLDALQFTSVRYTEEPLDSGVYSFKISRSKNNSTSFFQIDSISFANDSIVFIDSTALLDTLYTYYVNAVIPQINQISDPSNLASFRLLSKDIGVVNLIAPVTSRNLTNSETVEIDIENLGTDSINKSDTVFAAYSINGGIPVVESFLPDTNYGPSEVMNFQFTTKANLQAKGNYNFKTWTSFKRDNNEFNDSLTKLIVHKKDTVMPPNWTFNPSNFQYNMALTAEVYVIDTLSRDSADLIAAFSNGQVRGVANINFIPAFGKWVAQITVFSNLAIENINFKVWDASRDSIFDILETYTFINNQIYGSLTNPEKLHTISGSDFYDIGVSKQISPDPTENTFSNNENLVVQLKNHGSLDFNIGDSVEVFYQVTRKGITLRSGSKHFTFTKNLVSGDTVNFNMATSVNMADTGYYNFTFYTNWLNDIDKSNDTLFTQVLHYPIQTPIWTVDPSAFQYSSFLTARVLFDDVLSTDTKDMVAALVNNQVRGVANIENMVSFGEHVIQMAIYSNSASGEIIKFRAFDYSKNQTLWVEEEYKFTNNAILGSLINPERLHAVTGYNNVAELQEDGNLLLYPNPTNGEVFIISKQNQIQSIKIINSAGQTIYSENIQGLYHTFNFEEFPGGIYQIQINTDNEFKNFRCILTK